MATLFKRTADAVMALQARLGGLQQCPTGASASDWKVWDRTPLHANAGVRRLLIAWGCRHSRRLGVYHGDNHGRTTAIVVSIVYTLGLVSMI